MPKIEPDELDDLVVAVDHRSTRNWRARALGAAPEDIVAGALPSRSVHVKIRQDGYRLYSAWCKEQGMTMPDHIRACVVAALAAEGWSEAELRTVAFQSNRRP